MSYAGGNMTNMLELKIDNTFRIIIGQYQCTAFSPSLLGKKKKVAYRLTQNYLLKKNLTLDSPCAHP